MFTAVGSEGLINVEEAQEITLGKSSGVHLQPPVFNRYTFYGNVINPSDEERVSQWIVNYCPSWWEPCQLLDRPFADMAGQWETRLNMEIMSLNIRFAVVDCAVDKVLCNDQDVEGYPTVHRYIKGKRIASWTGGRLDDGDRLGTWLMQQLNTTATVTESKPKSVSKPIIEPMLTGSILDLFLVMGLLAVNLWAVVSNPQLWRRQPATAEKVVHQTAAPSVMVSDELTSGKGNQSECKESDVAGVSRFLPKEWAVQHQGMEL
jgi:hypothetical protein